MTTTIQVGTTLVRVSRAQFPLSNLFVDSRRWAVAYINPHNGTARLVSLRDDPAAIAVRADDLRHFNVVGTASARILQEQLALSRYILQIPGDAPLQLLTGQRVQRTNRPMAAEIDHLLPHDTALIVNGFDNSRPWLINPADRTQDYHLRGNYTTTGYLQRV